MRQSARVDSSIEISRRYGWDAAHRLPAHSGKCKVIHGHSYEATIHVAAALDGNSMVVDYGELDAVFGQWIKDNFDHTVLLDANDTAPEINALRNLNRTLGRPCYDLPGPPTAELISQFLLRKFEKLTSELSRNDVTITQVTVFESVRSSATAKLSDGSDGE